MEVERIICRPHISGPCEVEPGPGETVVSALSFLDVYVCDKIAQFSSFHLFRSENRHCCM